MAYGRKYYKEFDGYNAATRQSYTVLVDIYEDGFSGAAIEIEEISASPLQLSLDSSGDPLYTSIKKTSATFNIINTGQFDYSEFYTSNAKKYKMMITSTVFNWTGYLVPQAVSFDLATNGEFSLTASDGLHLLQSIDYVAAENDMTTLAAFLSDIEAKIGLSTFNRTSTISTEYGDIWNSLIYEGMFTNKTYEEAFEMVLKAIGMQVRYWKITPIISMESALQTASVKCVNDYPELNFLAPIKTAKLTKNITTLPSAFKNALVDDISDLKPRAANSYYTLSNWAVASDNGLVVFDIGANETDRKANKYKAINMFVKPTNATYDSQRLTGNEGSYFQLRPVQKTPFTLSFNANFGRISEYGRSSADGYRAYIHPVKWSSIKWGLYDSISNKSYSKTTNSWSITGTPTAANANELKVTDPADSFVDVYIPIPAPSGITANLRFYLFTGAVEYVNAAPVGESRTNRLSISSIDIDGEYVVSENELYTAVNGAVAVGDNIDVLDYEVDFGSVPVPPLNTSLYYGSAFFDNNLNQLEDIIIGANTVSHEQYLFNTILYTQNEIRKKVYTANVNMLTNVSPFWLKTTLKTDTVMVNACSFDFKTSQLNGEFTEIMPYVYREWAITSESEIGSSDWGGSGGQTGGSSGGGTVDTSNFVVKTGAVTQNIEGSVTVEGAVVAGALNGTPPDDLPVATSLLYGTIKFDPTTLALNGSNQLTVIGGGWSNVAWGTATGQYSPLTINSVTRNLSMDGHTHSYLPLSGGNLTGALTISGNNVWHAGNFNPSNSVYFNGVSTRFSGDANTLGLSTTSGIYNISTATNIPSGSSYGTILAFHNTDISTQLYIPYNGDAISWRKSVGNTYDGSVWRNVWDSSNFNPSNYLPLSGGIMTGKTVISTVSGITNTDNYTMLGYDSSYQYLGAPSLTTLIRSGFDTNLIHRKGTLDFKIWDESNDGAGSGLDADLLDGIQGNKYFTYRGSFTSSINANDMSDMGMWLNTTGNGSGNSNFPAQYGYIQTFSRSSENYSRWQMSVDNTGDNIHIRAEWAGTWGWWKKLWHSANSNLKTVDWNAKDLKCVNTFADGAVVAGALNGTLPDDLPVATSSLFGVIKTGLSLNNNAGVANINGRHYTTVSTYTDSAVREITAEIALGTGSMANGTLDQIQLSFAPLTTTRGLTANVIATNTGAGMGLKLSFRKDAGTGRWYIMIYNDSGAAVTRDGILLSIRGQQII